MYLTFDCYGTLIDWRSGVVENLSSAIGEMPLEGKALLDAYVKAEIEEEKVYRKYREVLARSAIRLAASMGVKTDEKAAARFAGSVPQWPPFPDTVQVLRQLREMGYRRYVLSNVDTDLLQQTIAASGLEVDGFVTAEEVGSYKPNVGHWKKFMEKTGVGTKGFVHVAQSLYHDIIPASEMGVDSVWVNRYGETLPPEAEPTCMVDSLTNLTQVLRPEGGGLI